MLARLACQAQEQVLESTAQPLMVHCLRDMERGLLTARWRCYDVTARRGCSFMRSEITLHSSTQGYCQCCPCTAVHSRDGECSHTGAAGESKLGAVSQCCMMR